LEGDFEIFLRGGEAKRRRDNTSMREAGRRKGGKGHRCARIKVTLGHLLYVIFWRVYTRVRSACTHTHPWDESFIIARPRNASRITFMKTQRWSGFP